MRSSNVVRIAVAAAMVLISPALFAIQPGTADGSVTINGVSTELKFAYVINGAKNPLTDEMSDTRVVLTDVALPEGTDLSTVGSAVPDGVKGIVFQIDRNRQLTSLVLHFEGGSYMAGTPSSAHKLRLKRLDEGGVDGTISVGKEKKSVVYQFRANFSVSLAE